MKNDIPVSKPHQKLYDDEFDLFFFLWSEYYQVDIFVCLWIHSAATNLPVKSHQCIRKETN